jgi:tRNA pseudouridine55 synthase
MNGIIVIDKPPNTTSAQVVARVKKISRAKKAGHTGTLDPFATGVLICCINKATRLAQFLVYGQKRYKGVMRLGIRTDTQDFTGRVVSRESDLTVTGDDVREAFQGFLGETYQNPPAYSALKHHGVPLYKLARQGTLVQKPARPISIHSLEVVDISNLPDVRFDVCCSGGTYVRTMCADIGEVLGCGAHLAELCRTETGGFSLEEAVSLETLAEVAARGEIAKHVVPMNVALRDMPCISGDDDLVQKIQLGRPVNEGEVIPVAEEAWPWIKVTDDAGNLVAVIHSNKKNGVYPYACVFGHPES